MFILFCCSAGRGFGANKKKEREKSREMEENTNEKRGPTVTLQPQNYLHCLAVLLPVLMLKLLSSPQEEVFLMPHFPE